MVLGTLPGWPLPTEFGVGYELREIGQGKRILPSAVVERFTQKADGTLGPLTEGSTQPVTAIVHHAGITKVKGYAFTIGEVTYGRVCRMWRASYISRKAFARPFGQLLTNAAC